MTCSVICDWSSLKEEGRYWLLLLAAKKVSKTQVAKSSTSQKSATTRFNHTQQTMKIELMSWMLKLVTYKYFLHTCKWASNINGICYSRTKREETSLFFCFCWSFCFFLVSGRRQRRKEGSQRRNSRRKHISFIITFSFWHDLWSSIHIWTHIRTSHKQQKSNSRIISVKYSGCDPYERYALRQF